ncbi:hypothetical protein [Acrocarpospora catenulata]|uniref:hypothetical protein n=1 Tax=Acrocarpospora catenulata TaxID=2836182 RepID=UPI001BD9EB35|nr:hypothetical protein [Acrocarpospora catenulata]
MPSLPPFDEEGYVREVLDPARQAGAPPEDLRARYRLHPDMAPAEVAETVRLVRHCWRRQRQLLKYRKLVDRLEADHAGYAPIFEAAAAGDTGPLLAALRQAGERDRRRVAQARQRLDDAAGWLRLLAPDVLAGIARSAGVDQREAAELAAGLGIEVREPDQLPEMPPYPGYGRAREALDTLRKRHLAEFLEEDRVSLFGPMPELAERVRDVEADWQRRTRGPWTISADTVLAALRGAGDPAELVRYDLVARLRERVREHPSDETLYRHATAELGLTQQDARRAVFAVRREGGGPSGPRARLRELVDAGEIQAAADLAATLPPGDELAAEIAARLAAAVRLRDQALTATDPDEAWLLLADALRRVPDLPGAAGLLARLAPHPAREVRAEARDATVTVTWRPSPSRAGEIDYEVRRDGVPFPVAEAGPGRAVDGAPPVNVPVRYTVLARRGEATAAPAAAEPLTVRPEPRDLRLTAGDGVVTGRWTTPPEAIGVVVLRDGVPVPVEGSGFRDRNVRNGTGHRYLVYAVYPTPDGSGVSTPGLHRTVTPMARPEPVPELTVSPAPDGRLLLRCAEPRTGLLEFRLLPGPPPWPPGTTLSPVEARGVGRALAATPVPEGHLIRPETGVVLALTVSGELVTVGAHRQYVHLTAPAVTAERRGPAVLVGLDWPAEVPEVEVGWGAGRLLVTAAAYRAQGGIRLDLPEDEPVTVEVVPTALVHGERLRGPAVTAHVPAVQPVRYDLRTEGPVWKRALLVEVTADRPARLARLTLVLKPGPIQPLTADDGRVLGEWTELTTPVRLSLPVPKQARPYWLRCFAEGDVTLLDPPVRRMKMG